MKDEDVLDNEKLNKILYPTKTTHIRNFCGLKVCLDKNRCVNINIEIIIVNRN